jgi:hypothetical protein
VKAEGVSPLPRGAKKLAELKLFRLGGKEFEVCKVELEGATPGELMTADAHALTGIAVAMVVLVSASAAGSLSVDACTDCAGRLTTFCCFFVFLVIAAVLGESSLS